MIRNDVAAILKRPLSTTASFSQILEETSRNSGNTIRVMRDLMALVLTLLEEAEKKRLEPKDEFLYFEKEPVEEIVKKYDKPKPRIL